MDMASLIERTLVAVPRISDSLVVWTIMDDLHLPIQINVLYSDLVSESVDIERSDVSMMIEEIMRRSME
jgi:hypothetical protein